MEEPDTRAASQPQPDAVVLARELGRVAESAGLTVFGCCSADPFPEVAESLRDRSDAGYSGTMSFTFAQPERSTDVRHSFPWAESLAVAGFAYLPAAGAPSGPEPGYGRIARFATEDHYRPLRAGLATVAEALAQHGHRAEVLADDNRLVDRAAAVRAGLGWWGKNTMVLAPKWGPWLLFGSVVTDAVLAPALPMRRDCGTCTACLPACPTGALVEPGVLDATKCLAYVTQAPEPIPRPLRSALGDRLYGCDDCLEACPPGSRLAEDAAAMRAGNVDLRWVLQAADDVLLEEFGRFYIPRRQARFLRRNALVALGNSGSEDDAELLGAYLGDDDPMLRSHAAWALGALGTRGGQEALSRRHAIETDSGVVEEIELALSQLS